MGPLGRRLPGPGRGGRRAPAERVPRVLADFPAAYDDPFSVEERAYVRDLVAGDTDLAWLADQRARREFAVPLPTTARGTWRT